MDISPSKTHNFTIKVAETIVRGVGVIQEMQKIYFKNFRHRHFIFIDRQFKINSKLLLVRKNMLKSNAIVLKVYLHQRHIKKSEYIEIFSNTGLLVIIKH